MDKEQIDKLESLLGKVERHLWHMKQRLPENQRQTFRNKIEEKMFDCSDKIVSSCELYIQKKGS